MSEISETGPVPQAENSPSAGGVGLLGRLSVGQKIMSIIVMCLAFLVAVGAVGIVNMAKIGSEIAKIAEADLPVSNAIGAITAGQLEQAILLEQGLRVGGVTGGHEGQFDKIVVRFDERARAVEQEIAKAEKLVEEVIAGADSADEKAEFTHLLEGLRKIDAEHKAFDHDADETFALIRENRIDEASQLAEKIESESENLNTELTAVMREIEKFTAEAAMTAEHDEQSAIVVIAIVAFAATVIGLVLATLLSVKGVSQPLVKIARAMDSLAAGNTDVTVDIRSQDEIGRLAGTFNIFRDKLIENKRLEQEMREQEARAEQEKREREAQAEQEKREREAQAETERQAAARDERRKMADEMEQQVGATIDMVSSAATEMEATATSLISTAEETNRQATAVSAASEETSTNVQSVSSAAEEMSSSIHEITRQVVDSTQIAASAVDEAQRTTETVQSMAESAEQIGKIVDLINDIAAQTNLLALNATIEAARAGEAGKGFAVVASEVKSLAGQTAKATEEIAQQVERMRSTTNGAVEAIAQISTTIGRIDQSSSAIAAAMEEQGAATQEITRNVQEASTGTSEVSKNISGVNEAAGQTGMAAEDVRQAAGNLSEGAAELKSSVASFLDKLRAA